MYKIIISMRKMFHVIRIILLYNYKITKIVILHLEDVIPACVVSVLQARNIANSTQSRTRVAPLV